MSMNIKNEETHRLVQQLAKLTGETQTAAVTSAVREKLARLRQGDQGVMAERLLDIGRDIGARLGESFRSVDHGDVLYDEGGLPR